MITDPHAPAEINCDASKSVWRAMRLLDQLSCCDSPVGIRELSRALGYPPTAIYRILSTMEISGFVRRAPDNPDKYVLGGKILQLGARLLEKLEVRRVALPVMTEVRDRCNETVDLFVADGAERLCVESVPSRQSVRWVATIGTRMPIYAGAAGKVLLAYLPDRQLEGILSKGLQKITSTTITDVDQLRDELMAVRARGWARSVGEYVAENACVAAPIRGGMPMAVQAAISIAVPVTRFTPSLEKMLVDLILEAADQISAMLGALSS